MQVVMDERYQRGINPFTKALNVSQHLNWEYRGNLSPTLRTLEGTKHVFQFRFDTESTAKRPNHILDRVLNLMPLTLPASICKLIIPAYAESSKPTNPLPQATTGSVNQTHSPLEQESTYYKKKKEWHRLMYERNRRERCCSKNRQKQMTQKVPRNEA